MADKRDDEAFKATEEAGATAPTEAGDAKGVEPDAEAPESSTPELATQGGDPGEKLPDTEEAVDPEADAAVTQSDHEDEEEPGERLTDPEVDVVIAGQETQEEAEKSEEMAQAAAAVTSPAPEAAPPAPRPRRGIGGFIALVLGGIIAAVIGFGVAVGLYPEGTPFAHGQQDRVTALQQQMQQQRIQLDALQKAVDTPADTSGIDDLKTQVGQLGSEVSSLSDSVKKNAAALSALTDRVAAVEKKPMDESVSAAAKKAYETEMAKLQETMKSQRAEVQQMISQAQQMKTEAAQTARATQIRGDLVQITSALDSGAPYDRQVQDLEGLGLDVPDALKTLAQGGAPTMVTLRTDFPEYARKALAATRDDSDTSSLTVFLKNQLGARSLTPHAGNDPDAVLSRAEAKLRQGDLPGALEELKALPDAATKVMQPWLDEASARNGAVQAVAGLKLQNTSK